MENKRRRRTLVTGKCDNCPNDAVLPWKGGKYCYHCWNDIMAKEAENETRGENKRRG
jgi:hypothetical protein